VHLANNHPAPKFFLVADFPSFRAGASARRDSCPLSVQRQPFSLSRRGYRRLSLHFGEGPRRPDGTVPSAPEAQFRQALDNIKATLEGAGLTLDNVVYVQVYLTNIGSYAEMNRVFAEYFPKTPPARAMLGVYALLIRRFKSTQLQSAIWTAGRRFIRQIFPQTSPRRRAY